jgi:hypothetical protein
MQSFITNGCGKQILFLCCTYKEQDKDINIIHKIKYTLNNEIYEKIGI